MGSISQKDAERTARQASASGLDDFAGLDASRADVDSLRRTIDNRPDPLDVRVPATLVAPVRVADAHPEGRVLATHLTDRSHDAQPHSGSFGTGFDPTRWPGKVTNASTGSCGSRWRDL